MDNFTNLSLLRCIELSGRVLYKQGCIAKMATCIRIRVLGHAGSRVFWGG
jgi:hypothetical protein